MGLLVFVVAAIVVGVRDAYVPAPEVDVCLDGSRSCEAWNDDEYRFDEVGLAYVAAVAGIAALVAALGTIAVREMVTRSRRASSSRAQPATRPGISPSPPPGRLGDR